MRRATVGVLVVAWLLWALSMWVAMHWGSLVPVLGFFAVASVMLIGNAIRSSHDRPPADPPYVAFTSTGVRFGERAWLWRGDDHWLDALSPPRLLAGTPSVLELTFVRPWRAREVVRIPIPVHSRNDVLELVEHLDHRLVGRCRS